MAFFRLQNVKWDDDGIGRGGTASLEKSKYVKELKTHSRRVLIEPLGQVVYIKRNDSVGVFLSPTKGLIECNAKKGEFSAVDPDDPRLAGWTGLRRPFVHTVFGDAYLALESMRNNGFLKILSATLPDRGIFERALFHLCHALLKDGSRIGCDDYYRKSFLSYLDPAFAPAALRSDTRFYELLSDDSVKTAFFKALVAAEREKNPAFGKACMIDSTPLPNEISDCFLTELCSHGLSGTADQARLVLVCDLETGIPVWFKLIAGNVLDFQTILGTVKDVSETLGVEIMDMVLDAGYVCRDLIEKINLGAVPEAEDVSDGDKKFWSGRNFVARMPAKKGYPFKSLYFKVKNELNRGKYGFVRNGHIYFGRVFDTVVFDRKEKAYVYVDKLNASQRFVEYMEAHADEYAGLKEKDKDWHMVSGGFFVLLSNLDMSPSDMLQRYFERTAIEGVFKTEKTYLDLLPLQKKKMAAVEGKILFETMACVAYSEIREKLGKSSRSMTEMIGKSQSLMCSIDSKDTVHVETANKQTKEVFQAMGIEIPGLVDMPAYRKSLGLM